MVSSLLVGGLVMISTMTLWADNGLAAFAFPLEELRIDGDLSDWPASIDRQEVRSVQHYDYPNGPEDGYVYFQSGYNLVEGVLYFGFEIHDDSRSAIVEASPEYQDRIGLFLDLRPLAVTSPSQNSLNYYFHLRHDFSGWMDQIQSGWSNIDDVASIAQQRLDDKWTIEIEIDVGKISGGEAALRSGANLGVDVGFFDVDLDQTASDYLWGRGVGKYEDLSYGDLFLLGDDEKLGSFIGKIQSAVPDLGICREFFYLRSTEHSDWPALMVVADQ